MPKEVQSQKTEKKKGNFIRISFMLHGFTRKLVFLLRILNYLNTYKNTPTLISYSNKRIFTLGKEREPVQDKLG